MIRLTEIPSRVWLLGVGDAIFYDAMVGDERGDLFVFQTETDARTYREMTLPVIESPALEVKEMSLSDLWRLMPKLNRECLKSFGCPLRLAVAETDATHNLTRVLETLWDPNATQH